MLLLPLPHPISRCARIKLRLSSTSNLLADWLPLSRPARPPSLPRSVIGRPPARLGPSESGNLADTCACFQSNFDRRRSRLRALFKSDATAPSPPDWLPRSRGPASERWGCFVSLVFCLSSRGPWWRNSATVPWLRRVGRGGACRAAAPARDLRAHGKGLTKLSPFRHTQAWAVGPYH